MKLHFFIIILILTISFSACSAGVENRGLEDSFKSHASDKTAEKSARSKPAENTNPIAVINAYNTASKAQDVEALRQSLSKMSFRLAEESAKKMSRTVSEVLNGCRTVSPNNPPPAYNEKIYTDTATVDVQNRVTGQYDKIPFVKEDGAWRIALDQFYGELNNKVNEELRKQENTYNNEVERIDNKYRIETAKVESQPAYRTEQELEILKQKQVLDRQKYNEKVALVNGSFATKKRIIENAEAIKRGVFFGCIYKSD